MSDGRLKDNQRKSNRGGRRPGAGRPKGTPNRATADIRAAAQEYTDEALKTLAKIMKSGGSDPARVAACKEILDRGHGKAAQPVTGEGGEGPITVIVRKFSGD